MSLNLLITLSEILKRYNQSNYAQVLCLQEFKTTLMLDDNILLRRQIISYCTAGYDGYLAKPFFLKI